MIRSFAAAGVLSSVALSVPLPEFDMEKLKGFGDLGKGMDLTGLDSFGLEKGLPDLDFGGFDKLNLFDKKDKKKGPCDFTVPIPKDVSCPAPPPALHFK
uniref:Uncharacterized protein n=1 Tax=Chromera velia CCMP2878 TaxID=1169474 RepID=A0A0G4GUN0_9ALVE|eukprot:Cvel_23432.t1-p1 / transcript=Cvel_23432.t1 / gene=Cvel_23432 / organism=Chromera_velia_CCMP2878 / gene_product=hypothetical protein / transcript_product=hypothetical protein / location=Cvel_scaffold2415:663-956(+) / protein_length=98 / sequence_SO=supercontig / SO=protein_coding / is_pseudo=false